jgi:probable DNA repair protein
MPKPLFNIKGLIDQLQSGTLVLTPNRRLARHIGGAWAQHCHQQGQQAWCQPAILSIDIWLLECWQLLQDHAYRASLGFSIVNDHAERFIWEQVIDKDVENPPGVDSPAFARLAQTALQNMERWQVAFSELAHSGHETSAHFLRWRRQFASELLNRQLLTPAQAHAFVWQAFQQNLLPRQEQVVLVGFQTTLAPLYTHIIDSAFNDVAHWHESGLSASKKIHVAANDSDEIVRAAQWAKQQAQHHPGSSQKGNIKQGNRIGVVFPNLVNQRHRIDRIFREIFTPDYCLPGTPHSIAPYNISAGIPLCDTPLVASGLMLLNLQRSPQPLDFYCGLLINPFWGDLDSTVEQVIRTQCQLLLLRANKLDPATADLRYYMKLAEDSVPDINSTLSRDLQQFENLCRQQSAQGKPFTGSFKFWVQQFSNRLKILGWPGKRVLDSIEYQQQQQWLNTLEEFSRLDNALDPVDADTALTQLTRLCGAQIFQAEDSDSPVLVLGLLEAAGLHFESLWLAEMHDGQWPQTPDYNPLLPVHVQRQHQMPRSSAETELAIAQRLLSDFENNCKELVFSFGQFDSDTERQISRLLASDLPELAHPLEPLDHPLIAEQDKPVLQRMTLGQAPSLPGDFLLRGGSAVLRDQARCPFNAFSIWRLGAEPLPEPTFEFTAVERGNLTHHVLELFWRRCKDSTTLNAMSQDSRDILLTESIAAALKQIKKDRPRLFGPRFSNIETGRLHQLICRWLDIEASRAPFVVSAQEQNISLQLGNLNLSLRIDRIDRLDDGSAVLIDYKTGSSSIKSFSDERPEELQLLLYALAIDQPLAALCFGQLSASKGVAIKGLGNHPEIAPSLTDLEETQLEDNWPDTLAVWRNRLSSLATEFCQGNAEMAVYSNTVINHQKYLRPLNRWYENRGDDNELTVDEISITKKLMGNI